MELINETTFQNAQVKAKVRPGRSLPPGRKRAAYTKMFFGLVYLGAFVLYSGKYNYQVALKSEFMKYSLLTRYVFSFNVSMSEDVNNVFLCRILLFQLGGPIERAKYYAIWTLTEVCFLSSQDINLCLIHLLQGASILTGLGFTGLNAKGEPQWDGAANVKVMQIEFAPNFKLLLDAWNVKTNVWLRECVYKRVTPKGKKPGFTSSMITFFTSAFWVCGFFFCVFSRLLFF